MLLLYLDQFCNTVIINNNVCLKCILLLPLKYHLSWQIFNIDPFLADFEGLLYFEKQNGVLTSKNSNSGSESQNVHKFPQVAL